MFHIFAIPLVVLLSTCFTQIKILLNIFSHEVEQGLKCVKNFTLKKSIRNVNISDPTYAFLPQHKINVFLWFLIAEFNFPSIKNNLESLSLNQQYILNNWLILFSKYLARIPCLCMYHCKYLLGYDQGVIRIIYRWYKTFLQLQIVFSSLIQYHHHTQNISKVQEGKKNVVVFHPSLPIFSSYSRPSTKREVSKCRE